MRLGRGLVGEEELRASLLGREFRGGAGGVDDAGDTHERPARNRQRGKLHMNQSLYYLCDPPAPEIKLTQVVS